MRAAARLGNAHCSQLHTSSLVAFTRPALRASSSSSSRNSSGTSRRARGLCIHKAVPFPQQPDRADIRTASSVSDSVASQQRPSAFKKLSITGDGSCMFRAVAQGHHLASHGQLLPEAEEKQQARVLRKAVVEELKKRREDIEPFLPGIADDFDEYLTLMSSPGVWGGEPELVMASHVLQRPISVYQSGWGGPQFILTYGEEYAPAADPLHLLWSGSHYDLLLPQQGSKL